MFKRFVRRKKKAETQDSGPVSKHSLTEDDPSSDEVRTDDSFESEEGLPDDAPGLKRATSEDLLARKASIKSRELSTRSQVRLEVVRWRSNLNCNNEESELVPEANPGGYGVARSSLTIGTSDRVEDPIFVPQVSSRGDSKRSCRHSRHSAPQRVAAPLAEIKKSLPPPREARTAAAASKDVVCPASTTTADGNLDKSGGSSARKSILKQTRFLAKSLSRTLLDDDETIEEQEVKAVRRSVKPATPPVVSPQNKKSGPFRFFRRRSKDSRSNRDDDDDFSELNDDTCLGMCFDTSCVWMFGEPTEVLDCFDCVECGTTNEGKQTTAATVESGVPPDMPYKGPTKDDNESVGSSRSGGSSGRRRPRLISFPFRGRTRSSQQTDTGCIGGE